MAKTIQDFSERWRNKANEIKNQSFNREQCASIMNEFRIERDIMYLHTYKMDRDLLLEYQEIENDLSLALKIAYSNFEKRKKGFWSKIFGGKKELTLFKIK